MGTKNVLISSSQERMKLHPFQVETVVMEILT